MELLTVENNLDFEVGNQKAVEFLLIESFHQASIFEFARENDIQLISNVKERDKTNVSEFESGPHELENQIIDDRSQEHWQSAVNENGYRSLAAGIILQALKDIKKGNADLKREAMNWLQSKKARFFFECLEIDIEGLDNWASNGMPLTLSKADKLFDE